MDQIEFFVDRTEYFVWSANALAVMLLVAAGVIAYWKVEIPRAVVAVIRGLYAVLCSAPAICLLILLALLIRARGAPADMDAVPILGTIIWATFGVAILGVPLAIPTYAFLSASGRRPHPTSLCFLVVGWVSLFLLPLFGPIID